jgi:hypothetical protein
MLTDVSEEHLASIFRAGRRHISPKSRLTLQGIHGVIYQKDRTIHSYSLPYKSILSSEGS